MLLCIDIGNTNIVAGVFEDCKLKNHWRIKTKIDMTSNELSVLINTLFLPAQISLKNISNTIISCVVPQLLNTFREFCRLYLDLEPMVVGTDIETGMVINYDNPKEVGADRIVNAVAAYRKYQTGLIVVDFGTATTFDYISPEGAYEGGAIAPGIGTSAEALFEKASKLPRIETLDKPKTVITKETLSGMKSGLIYGYACLVDGIVDRMKQEAGFNLTVIATGGLAPLIKSESRAIDHIEEFLTLDGLKIIFQLNSKG